MSENLQINLDNKLNAVDQKDVIDMDIDAYGKIQINLNIVRNCLQNRMQIGKKTDDALIESNDESDKCTKITIRMSDYHLFLLIFM